MMNLRQSSKQNSYCQIRNLQGKMVSSGTQFKVNTGPLKKNEKENGLE
jgi:hypothetical protein